MHLKSIALVALVAAVSAGCKCSPDRPTNGNTDKTSASQRKKEVPKNREGRTPKPGTTHHVAHGSANVAYTVYVPDKVAPDAALPAIVMLLDRGQAADRFPDRYNIVQGSRKLGYALAVVAPPGGKRAHWGHGLCKTDPGAAAASAAPSAKPLPSAATAAPSGSVAGLQVERDNELELINAVIGDLSQKHKIDSTKITVLGVGEGAAMAHRIAAELPSVASAVLVSPRAACAAPTAPIQPEQGRSVLIVAGPSPANGGDAGGTPPTWEKLAFEAWSAAGKCTAPVARAEKGSGTTALACADGQFVHFVQEPKAQRGWPSRVGGLYTMRAIHNFLTQH